VRPALAPSAAAAPEAAAAPAAERPAQVFVVPICSALGLDGVAYEHFLLASGALESALALLRTAATDSAEAASLARKEIQALVMAAEVQHIVDGMSA
jgi:hypothetical protein